MGLDIYHRKLTTLNDVENKDDFYLVEDLEELSDIDFSLYEKYLTDIEIIEYDETIYLFESKEHYNSICYLMNFEFDPNENNEIIYGEYNFSTWRKLYKLINKKGRIKSERLILRSGICNSEDYYIRISLGERVIRKGVYYKIVGYQRKGMNDAFYDRYYGKELLLYSKKDFLFSYKCTGDEWYLKHYGEEFVKSIKNNFKENFIDNYEYGRSLLDISF